MWVDVFMFLPSITAISFMSQGIFVRCSMVMLNALNVSLSSHFDFLFSCH